ncbi:MAG: phage tail tape measure protein [Caldilineaceae bacterium]|nr:phage tail tape measure protein [Caldilineaceae bacterium]
MLQRLVPASNPAYDAMRELGIITEDGANKFFDAEGNLRSMGEIAGVLATAMVGLSEEQKNQALSTIFGTDAMRAAVALAETGEEGFAALKKTMGDVDAEEMAAKRMDTFAGSLEIAKGVVDGLKMQIGQEFLPVFRDMVDWFTSAATEHGPAVVAMFGSLISSSAMAFTMLRSGYTEVKASWDTIRPEMTESTAAFQRDMVGNFNSITESLARLFGYSGGRRGGKFGRSAILQIPLGGGITPPHPLTG